MALDEIEITFDQQPPDGDHRARTPRVLVLALVAVAALIGAVLVSTAGDDEGDVDVAVDEDGSPDDERDAPPDLEGMPAPIALGGPTDGKDSVGLPVKVEPSTGLVDGQTVSVTAAGFPPGQSVGVVMCAKEAGRDHGARGAEACNLGRYASATSSSDGIVQVEFQVQRIMLLDGQEIDCASEPDRCLVGVGLISDYDQSGGALVSFDADEPLPDPPTVETDRSDGLVDGDAVDVRITGLVPRSNLWAQQCDLATESCASVGELVVDADGTVTHELRVWRSFGAFVDPSAGDPNVDCASTACELRFEGQVPGMRVIPTVPLAFDPAPAARTPPQAALAEPGPFPPDGTIPLVLRGASPGSFAEAMVCSPQTGCWGGAGAPVGDDGSARLEIDLATYPPDVGCDAGCVVVTTLSPQRSGGPPPLFPPRVPVDLAG